MAIRLTSASSQFLKYTGGGLFDYNAPYTALMSVRLTTDTNTRTSLLLFDTNGSNNSDSLEMGFSGTTLQLVVNDGTPVASTTDLVVGAWTNVALARHSATDLRMYVNGVQQGSAATTNVAGRAAQTIARVGTWFDTFNFLDGRVANLKIYSRLLTTDEMLMEHGAFRPISTSSLWCWLPMVHSTTTDAVIDYSGNARNFSTSASAPTIEDGPPISWGAFPIIPEQTSVIYSFARPIEDIASSNNWLTSTGSTRYTLIDEALADDTDYIYANTAALTSEVKVEPIIGPQGNILVSYKVQNIGGRGNVTVSMYAGSTLIKSDTKRNVADVYTMTVTSAEYSSVTDWSNIRLRFVTG